MCIEDRRSHEVISMALHRWTYLLFPASHAENRTYMPTGMHDALSKSSVSTEHLVEHCLHGRTYVQKAIVPFDSFCSIHIHG